MKYIDGLVSVIIPTYRRQETVMRAVDSALSQTYRKIEVLLVDDNEIGDNYSKYIRSLPGMIVDKRFHLITQTKHINGAAARNAGIKAAKGEYIAFLDDDDFWEKEKIDIQVKVLSELDQTWGAVTCKNKHYVNGRLTAALPCIRSGYICKDILLRRVEVSTDAILARHSALDDTGYFDEKLTRHQEVQLMTYLTSKYKVRECGRYLVCVDSSKSENQPDPLKMEKIKSDFFTSISPVIDRMTSKEKKQIYTMHTFEIGLLMLRNGMRRAGLTKCLSVFRFPYTVYLATEYIIRKVNSRIFAQVRVNRDL